MAKAVQDLIPGTLRTIHERQANAEKWEAVRCPFGRAQMRRKNADRKRSAL